MLLRNYVLRYFLAYHETIDTLPIFNFMECMDGNLQYLYKYNINKLPTKYPKKFEKVKKELFYQLDYIDTTIFQLENRIARRTAKYIETGKSIWYVRAQDDSTKLAQKKLDAQINVSNAKKYFNSQLMRLSRFQGPLLNKFTLTTREYFNILHDYNEHIKAQSNG